MLSKVQIISYCIDFFLIFPDFGLDMTFLHYFKLLTKLLTQTVNINSDK